MRDRQVRDVVACGKLIKEIDEIFSFTAGLTPEEFAEDELTKKAVAMSFINIGELAKNMGDQSKIGDILPSGDIRRLRNQLAHTYDTADFKKIWLTVKQVLPRLRKRLLEYKKELQAKPEVLTKLSEQKDKASLIEEARKRDGK